VVLLVEGVVDLDVVAVGRFAEGEVGGVVVRRRGEIGLVLVGGRQQLENVERNLVDARVGYLVVGEGSAVGPIGIASVGIVDLAGGAGERAA